MVYTRTIRRKRTTNVRKFKPKRKMATRRSKYRRQRILVCPTSIPDRMRVKLPFGAVIAVTTIGGAVGQVFAVQANRTPLGGTGYASSLNPQGFDQWANMYLNYRPLAMHVKHSFGITQEQNGVQAVYMRGYWSAAGVYSNDTHVIQNRFTKTRYLNSDSTFKTISTYSNLRNVVGQTWTQWMNDEQNTSQVTTIPSRVVHYYLHISTISGSVALNGQLETTGDIWFEFFNPRLLVDS